jgi:hypothetical protein
MDIQRDTKDELNYNPSDVCLELLHTYMRDALRVRFMPQREITSTTLS